MMGRLHLQDPTLLVVGIIFFTTRWETTRASRKPLTDYPLQPPTSRTEKKLGLEYFSRFTTKLIKSQSRDPE